MDFSTPQNLLIAGVYWVLVGLISLFSLFGVYILIRYGRSLIFSLVLAVLYAFFYLTLLGQSYALLRKILSA